MTTTTQKLFLVRAGASGEDENYALEHGVAIIRFSEYPSLAIAKDYAAVLALVKAAIPQINSRAAGNHAGQLWAYAVAMQVGDIVVMPRKITAQVALGRVTGPYKYEKAGGVLRHLRNVEWIRPDVPRTAFGQDLLQSFGALKTVYTVARNNALQRVTAVLAGKTDPSCTATQDPTPNPDPEFADDDAMAVDLALAAHDQIVAHIQARFHGHALAQLVNAVLTADGWTTKLSPPGPDGGVDIFAGQGSFGLDSPRLCVQVKSQNTPADATVYRTLQGSMLTFNAEQGLLVCWGGFNKVLLAEAKPGHFTVRLWNSSDLVQAIYRTYEKLPAEIQTQLPLKRAWMLIQDESET